jgi:hypothetical protein
MAQAPDGIAHKLRKLVVQNTRHGRHRTASLELLSAHLERGFTAEILDIDCHHCGDRVSQCVRWTEGAVVVDTWGYMEFANENCCCECLDEGYIGDIFMPKKELQ